jgi:molybdenum cofactor biosynthesis enzyme MoaA
VLRLIEFMDVGTTNGWRLDDVVAAAEIIALIGGRWPLELLAPSYPGEVACPYRYRYRDGGGEIGVIASVTQPFCRGCTRARLSAEGSLCTCLFAGAGHDLRGGGSDEALRAQVASVWTRRADRYSELCSLQHARSRRWRCRTLAASRPRGQERPDPRPGGPSGGGAGHDMRDRRAMHRCQGQGRSSLPAAGPVPPMGR